MGEGFSGSEETGRALVAVERARFMPAMSIESAVERYNAVTEFVTQDVEDIYFNAATVARKTSAESPDVAEEIRAACRALGKTEEQLAGWLRKKYGADGIEHLTDADRREVLTLLQGMLSKRAA